MKYHIPESKVLTFGMPFIRFMEKLQPSSGNKIVLKTDNVSQTRILHR